MLVEMDLVWFLDIDIASSSVSCATVGTPGSHRLHRGPADCPEVGPARQPEESRQESDGGLRGDGEGGGVTQWGKRAGSHRGWWRTVYLPLGIMGTVRSWENKMDQLPVRNQSVEFGSWQKHGCRKTFQIPLLPSTSFRWFRWSGGNVSPASFTCSATMRMAFVF